VPVGVAVTVPGTMGDSVREAVVVGVRVCGVGVSVWPTLVHVGEGVHVTDRVRVGEGLHVADKVRVGEGLHVGATVPVSDVVSEGPGVQVTWLSGHL